MFASVSWRERQEGGSIDRSIARRRKKNRLPCGTSSVSQSVFTFCRFSFGRPFLYRKHQSKAEVYTLPSKTPTLFDLSPYHKTVSAEPDANVYDRIQAIVGTDAGNRGMKALIVRGDLEKAAESLGTVGASRTQRHVVVLSGFPCCVHEDPPTETDGPPGSFAIARCAAAMGCRVTVVTDQCNEKVFAAGLQELAMPCDGCGPIGLEVFPACGRMVMEDHERLEKLKTRCALLVACERAGPGVDGKCYTMRGIDMNALDLIAPLHRLTENRSPSTKFLAIGDGGNELGMGKVLDRVFASPEISNGKLIGCAVAADSLIAASVSNWGAYALAAAAAVWYAKEYGGGCIEKWMDRCLPTEEQETTLLRRCVAAGCRDGISGKMEATVDGMSLEASLQCLRDIRKAALCSTTASVGRSPVTSFAQLAVTQRRLEHGNAPGILRLSYGPMWKLPPTP